MRFVLFVNENNKQKCCQRIEDIVDTWNSVRVVVLCITTSDLQDEITERLKEIKGDLPSQVKPHLICETEDDWEKKVMSYSPLDIASNDLVCFVDENLTVGELAELIEDGMIVARTGAASAWYE